MKKTNRLYKTKFSHKWNIPQNKFINAYPASNIYVLFGSFINYVIVDIIKISPLKIGILYVIISLENY